MRVATRKIRQRFKGKLKFCKKCNYVWEISTEGTCMRYNNMPSYKLPRIICKNCDKSIVKNKQEVFK